MKSTAAARALYVFRIYSYNFCKWWIGGHAPSTPPGYAPVHKIFILFVTSVTFGQFRCVSALHKFFFGPRGAPFFSAEHAEH